MEINLLKNVYPFQMDRSKESESFLFRVTFNSKYEYLKYIILGSGRHLAGMREDSSPTFVTVETQTLDYFVLQNKILGIDLIELDIEESEHLILESGGNVIRKMRPKVVCEVFSTEKLYKIQIRWNNGNYLFFIF